MAMESFGGGNPDFMKHFMTPSGKNQTANNDPGVVVGSNLVARLGVLQHEGIQFASKVTTATPTVFPSVKV